MCILLSEPGQPLLPGEGCNEFLILLLVKVVMYSSDVCNRVPAYGLMTLCSCLLCCLIVCVSIVKINDSLI